MVSGSDESAFRSLLSALPHRLLCFLFPSSVHSQAINPEFSPVQRLLLALVPPLAAAFIRLLGSTLHYQDVCAPGVIPGDRQSRPAIFAFWHRSLLTCAHRFRGQQIAILISRSFDGELIARTVERLGFIAVRGSSSRAAVSGLRGLERAYRRGHLCAVTADGPRGPSQVAKSGVVHLAALVHAPALGVFYALPERAWTLKTWDRFLIPKPFSRVLIAWPSLTQPNLLSLQFALEQAVAMAEQHGARI